LSKLLLVEDDLSLGQTLTERLELQSYDVAWVKTLQQAREKIKNEIFDLIILDVGLPDGSGFDFANEVKIHQRAPFIFMTAMAQAPQRLEGFEIGAEEYIPKPFHLREILIRIKHVLETHSKKKEIFCGKVKIDMNAQSVIDENGKVEFLPARDFKLLELLINSAPRVVSRDEILENLWGNEKFPTNRTIDNVIVRLRSLLHDEGQIIRSVRGVGYQWVKETKEIQNG
jgi:two-component system, OmpR family, phosphate regulon response regulator PhoB